MITQKEKDLTIQLLTEKLQKISGKKVILEEISNSLHIDYPNRNGDHEVKDVTETSTGMIKLLVWEGSEEVIVTFSKKNLNLLNSLWKQIMSLNNENPEEEEKIDKLYDKVAKLATKKYLR